MSYILEALKKSEQARQRNCAAPAYSLQPVVAEEPVPPRLWPYALGAALLLNAAVLYLWLRQPPQAEHAAHGVSAAASPAPERKPETVPPAKPVGPASPMANAALPDPHPVRPPEAPAVQVPTPPPADGGPAPEVRPPVPVEVRPPIVATVLAPGTMPAPGAGETRRKGPRTPVAEAVRPGKEAEAQAESAPSAAPPALPPVSVSGFVREEGSAGMVIVNQKLLREGDEVMPDLKLEKILEDGVIFSYKGQRFKR